MNPADPDKTMQTDLVPETLPAPMSPVCRPRYLPFPVGMIGLWFFPATTGPHLLAAPMTKAIKAQLLAAILTAVIIAAIAVPPYQPTWSGMPSSADDHPPVQWPLLTRARIAIAKLVVLGMKEGDYTLLFIPLAWGGLLVGTALLALLLVPWACAGDAPASLIRRTVRLAFWFTTLAVPLALFVAAAQFAYVEFGMGPADDFFQNRPALVLMILCGATYLLWVLTRVTDRYAGPADGPGFAPITPTCTACGYRLQGLPRDANCPECNQPVQASLPPVLTAYVPPPGANALHRLTHSAPRIWFRPARFFTELPVGLAHRPAKRLFMRSTVVFLVLAALCDAVSDRFGSGRPIFASGVGILAIFTGLTIFAGVRLLIANHRADNRAPACVAFFASAMIWPFTAALILSYRIFLFLEPHTTFLQDGIRWLAGLVLPSAALDVCPIPANLAAGVAVTIILIAWGLLVRKGIRLTRYANR